MALTARARFAALVAKAEVPLAEACFEAGQHLGHPLTAAEGAERIDALAAEVAGHVGGPGEVDVAGVVAQVHDRLGFRGDRDTYYDLRNSLLGDVLDRRRGIPITLAVVVIEVAARLGTTATGVGMPGHFLVGDGPSPTQWFDPFDGPAPIDEAVARERFRALHGAEVAFDPGFLRPTPRPQILGRILANAGVVLRRAGDPRSLLRALELRSEIAGVGTTPRARVELAEAYQAVGRVADAVETLGAVRLQVDPRRRALVDERIERMRSSLS